MIDTGCLWTKQIRVSQQDELTDLTAREILGHNKARAEWCALDRLPERVHSPLGGTQIKRQIHNPSPRRWVTETIG